jgi:hypothetical protein
MLPRKPVDELEGLWMREILGIMNHDNFTLDPLPLLIPGHGVVRGVQAVPLGSWPIMRTECQVHSGIAARDPADSLQRQRVIGVHANKEVVAPMK